VVAVRDVEKRDVSELLDEAPRGLGLQPPEGVRDAVFRGEVVDRFPAGGVGDEAVDLRAVAVSQKDRTGLCRQRHHVARAVVLLVPPRALVLPHDVGVVLVEGERGGDAGLFVAVGPEPVQVEGRLRLPRQGALAGQPVEVFGGAEVDPFGVRVGSFGEVDLGPGDVEEAPRVSGGQRPRLSGRDHVVGDGGDASRHVRRRTKRLESMDRGHGGQL